MKFGQQLQRESVPEWSVHNIDYNTLKEFIKVHTTRDQATAICIPGQKDTALYRFENDFYEELCRQHDRLGLFVATKADEINQRLQHLSSQTQRLLLRSPPAVHGTAALKRQRRFAKYDRAAEQLGDEIRDLSRFVRAQVVAFRKILKKYRKWTGSSALGARFQDNILSDPKSFTRRDFTHLANQCDELLATIRASTLLGTSASPPSPPSPSFGRDDHRDVHSSSSSTIHVLSSSAGSSQPLSLPQQQQQQQQSRPRLERATSETTRRVKLLIPSPAPAQHYWNEYDDGSEAGDAGGGSSGYALYLHPDDETDFPGMATLVSFFTGPLAKAKQWMAARGVATGDDGDDGIGVGPASRERDPLLPQTTSYGTNGSAAAAAAAADGGERAWSETWSQRRQRRRLHPNEHDGAEEEEDDDNDNEDEDEDAFASDAEFPRGYVPVYAALPSVNDQRLARYRETMLFRGTVGCFAAAVVLLGVAAVLVATGRHKLRVEVDAGVIVGVVTSLGFACAALGLSLARHDVLGLASRLAVGTAFAVVCVLNGAVLVLVMGNTVV